MNNKIKTHYYLSLLNLDSGQCSYYVPPENIRKHFFSLKVSKCQIRVVYQLVLSLPSCKSVSSILVVIRSICSFNILLNSLCLFEGKGRQCIALDADACRIGCGLVGLICPDIDAGSDLIRGDYVCVGLMGFDVGAGGDHIEKRRSLCCSYNNSGSRRRLQVYLQVRRVNVLV